MERSQRQIDLPGVPARLSWPLVKTVAERAWRHATRDSEPPAIFGIVVQAQHHGPPEELRCVTAAVSDLPAVARACESMLSRVEALPEEQRDRRLIYVLAVLRHYIEKQAR